MNLKESTAEPSGSQIPCPWAGQQAPGLAVNGTEQERPADAGTQLPLEGKHRLPESLRIHEF